jgi:hypothetical protein
MRRSSLTLREWLFLDVAAVAKPHRRKSAFRPHRPPYARPSDSKRIALSVALSKGTLYQKRQATEIK